LDELLGSVVEKLGPGYADRFKTPADRFRAAAFYACGYFDAIRGSIRLREAYAPENQVNIMLQRTGTSRCSDPAAERGRSLDSPPGARVVYS
jgi:hypothetical protein